MKKLVNITIIAISILLLSGCGTKGNPANETQINPKLTKPVITNEKFIQVESDPGKFKGDPIEVTGRVFNNVETKDGITGFQMWTDAKESKGSLVVYSKSTVIPKDGDYVKVKGTIKGKLEGENAFGAKISSTTADIDIVEKVNAMDVLAPTKSKYDINKTATQNGFTINLQKIEFAETETRLYVQLKNDSKGKVNFYSFNAKAIQNGKQFEPEYTEYPELQSELLSGITSNGIITFKPLDSSTKSAQFHFEGSFEDYSITFEPMKIDVAW